MSNPKTLNISQNDEVPFVTPGFRVVPAGSTGDKLRLTVLVHLDPGGSGGILLSNWPAEFASKLRGDTVDWQFDVHSRLLEKGHDLSAPIPRPDSCSFGKAVLVEAGRAKDAFTPGTATTLSHLWSSSIQLASERLDKDNIEKTPWKTLGSALTATGGVGVSKTGIGHDGVANPFAAAVSTIDETNIGDEGQLKRDPSDQPGNLESVVAVPQSDLALAIESVRAHAVLKRLSASYGLVAQDNFERPNGGFQSGRNAETPPPEKTYQEELKADRLKRLMAASAEAQDARRLAWIQYSTAKARLNATTCDQLSRSAPRGQARVCPPVTGSQERCETEIDGAGKVASFATWPQYETKEEATSRNQNWPSPETAEDISGSLAVQTFFTIQSTPSLARAFLLAFDLEIEWSNLAGSAAADGQARFLFLSATLKGDSQCRPTFWTLCKLQKCDDRWHFWPAPMAEAVAYTSGCAVDLGSLRQRDAVVIMGEGWGDAVGGQRFDLTTLDIRAAVEAEERRKEADALAADGETTGELQAKLRETESARVGTQQTGGLTLLQRDVQRDQIERLAAKIKKVKDAPGGDVVLDADDLTVGFRLMVGQPDKAWTTKWSPLMMRNVAFGSSGDREGGALVERVLAKLYGADGQFRATVDAAHVTHAARIVPSLSSGKGREAVLEEAFVTWDGSPMGVDCSSTGKLRDLSEDALCFGRTLSLPTKGTDRPFSLRYGQPYRMAMLPVYSGGASLRAKEMPVETNACCHDPVRGRYYYPPIGLPPLASAVATATGAWKGTSAVVRPYVRALRHDRIAAPVVLITEGQVRARRGPMAPESAREMVIRSHQSPTKGKPGAKLASRITPALCQRLILVPTLTQDEAARHGQFDHITASAKVPGAYIDARHRPEGQGFPVTLSRHQTGLNGRRFLLDRRIEFDPAPGGEVAGEDAPGDPVWSSAAAGGPQSSYFPDPMATSLAIGLRRPGPNQPYLQVETYPLPPRSSVPFAPCPVLLSVEPIRSTTPAGLSPTTTEAKKDIARYITRLAPKHPTNARHGSGGKALSIRLGIKLGEEWEVDLWCVPTGENLARNFAVVQRMAVVLAQKCQPGFDCTEDSICEGLADHKLSTFLTEFRSHCVSANGACDTQFVAPGGSAAPPNRVLKALGAALSARLAEAPVPELSAVTTLSAVHAVNRVPAAAKIVADLSADPFADTAAPAEQGGLRPLFARRLPPKAAPKTLTPDLKAPNPDVISLPNETGLVLGGDVGVDLEVTGAIEIWAEMVHPTLETFDDPDRGRSPAMLQSDTWPRRLTGGPEELQKPRTARAVFGFNVGADGRIAMPSSRVLLLRIDDLPRVLADQSDRVPLLPYFLCPPDPRKGWGRVTHRHVMPDTKARVMCIKVNAIPRTAPRMATIDRVAWRTDPFAPRSNVLWTKPMMLPSTPLFAEDMEHLSDPALVPLPTSRAPVAPVALAPVPVFRWTPDPAVPTEYRAERRSSIRLRFDRGWFSSGEDERVGIVLWPPALGRKLAPKPGTALIPDRPSAVELKDFRDSDLGPGGAFVSRRGGDPVRAGGHEGQLFLLPQDIDGIGAIGPDAWPKLEPSVIMPVVDPDAGTELPPLIVSLATFEPRFDAGREEWYVDVDLRPGGSAEEFVRFGLVRYQPHADKAMRCSTPVVQWAQPLPHRSLSVRPLNDDLLVVLRGRAAGHRKGEEVRFPALRATLFGQAKDSEGRILRRPVALHDGPEDYLDVAPRPVDKNGEVVWVHRLRRSKLRLAGPMPLVMLEEIESFRPATYPKEPVPAEIPISSDLDIRGETGPRYAHVVDLAAFVVPDSGIETATKEDRVPDLYEFTEVVDPQ